ncbi:MAG: hypothetical protein L0Z48_02130, partial [candidate division Zixibacteria bacterium]|nr:hypothetical protein [candidate division Zixibacteria bacterium]
MNSKSFLLAGFLFLGIISFYSSALAEEDSLFYCSTPDSIGRTVQAGQQTLSPVAIFACGTDASTDRLPSWYSSIFNFAVQLSVPRFYRDNSLGKYIMNSTAFGLNDTLCFSFSYPANGLMQDHDGVGQWFQEVITQADDSIDFASFDADSDGVVDGLFFMIVNHTSDDGFAPLQSDFNYTTNDPAAGGGYVEIVTERVVVVKPSGHERAIALAAHEWGHVLGLPELYGRAWNDFNRLGYWDLGSFSIMGTGFPGLRAVPFDPYSRIRLGWDTAIVVNSPLYDVEITDYLTTGAIYKLPKSSTEYFLVTNHKGVDPENDSVGKWEERMPGILGGLLVWHIDENALFDFGMQLFNKRVDCELAQGLFTYPLGYESTTVVANAVSGRDSLDFLKKKPGFPRPWDTTWIGFKPPNIAS